MSLTQSKEVNSLSKRYSTHIERRITRTVMVGDIAIGSDYPVRVQSMINEDTMDVENAYLAIKRLHDVGCEIVRLTVPSLAHAKAVGDIKAKLLEKLNQLAGKNGIGRVDLVENRFIGIKSRGVYETPGGTLLMHAHRAMESVTLDKDTMHKKDQIMPRYAELIYNGYWYSKERFKLQKIVDLGKNKVNGSVKLKLYKGNVTIISRQTKSAAYSMKKVSFEENKTFNKSNVERFINYHKKKLRY